MVNLSGTTLAKKMTFPSPSLGLGSPSPSMLEFLADFILRSYTGYHNSKFMPVMTVSFTISFPTSLPPGYSLSSRSSLMVAEPRVGVGVDVEIPAVTSSQPLDQVWVCIGSCPLHRKGLWSRIRASRTCRGAASTVASIWEVKFVFHLF